MRRAGAYMGVMTILVAKAQGTLLTLSAVEMITSFTVPLSCIFAYNTPISGCEISDFTGGQCSGICQRGLLRVQANIRASCDTVDAQPNSLIWEAQRGDLVGALCKRGQSEHTSTATRPRPTPSSASESRITVTIPESSTTSKTSFSSVTTSTTSTTEITVSSTTDSTTSSTAESSSSSESESQTETRSSSTLTSFVQVTTTTADRSITRSSAPSTTTAKVTQDPEAGAGDPFANYPNSSSRLGPYIWGALLGVFVMGLL